VRELSGQLCSGWYVWVAKLPLHVNEFEDVRRDFKYILKRSNALIVNGDDKKTLS
jgi:hypothetical protein